jgi:hypothetical protein
MKPNLYVLQKERYYTKIGITLSILSILTILTLTLYFIYSGLNKNNKFIRFNTDSNLPKMFNISDEVYMFVITDGLGNIFQEQERLFYFHIEYFDVSMDQGSVETKGLNKVILEKCNITNYLNTSWVKTYPRLYNYYCIPKNDFTIRNMYGDISNGFEFASIFINKCSNSSNITGKTDCFSSDIIEKRLSKSLLNILRISYDINHDENDPFDSHLISDVFDLSTTIFQKIYYPLKRTIYNTEEGLVFTQTVSVNFTQVEQTRIYSDFRKSGIDPETFSTIIFTTSEGTDIYYRSYLKIQDVVANIGGMINGILTIGSILVHIITKNMTLFNLTKILYSMEDIKIGLEDISNMNRITLHPNIIRRVSISNGNNVHSTNEQSSANILENSKKNNTSYKLRWYEYVIPIWIFNKNNRMLLLKRFNNVLKRCLSIEFIIGKFIDLNKVIEMMTVDQKSQLQRMPTIRIVNEAILRNNNNL